MKNGRFEIISKKLKSKELFEKWDSKKKIIFKIKEEENEDDT